MKNLEKNDIAKDKKVFKEYTVINDKKINIYKKYKK